MRTIDLPDGSVAMVHDAEEHQHALVPAPMGGYLLCVHCPYTEDVPDHPEAD